MILTRDGDYINGELIGIDRIANAVVKVKNNETEPTDKLLVRMIRGDNM